MDKRDEQLREAEIEINSFLTIAIVLLTMLIATTNEYVIKIPELVLGISISMGLIIIATLFVLIRKVLRLI